MKRMLTATMTGCVAGMLVLSPPALAQPRGPVPSQAPDVPRIGGSIDDYGQWRSPYFYFRMDRSTQMEMPFLDVATAIVDSDRALLVVNFYYDGGRYSNYQQAILRRILYYLSSKLPNVEVRLLDVMVASSDGRAIYDKELFKYYAANTLGQYGTTIQGQPVMPYGQVYLAGKLIYDFSVMWEARDDDQVMENARAIQSSMLRIAGQASVMQMPDRKDAEPDVREPDLPPELPPERLVDAPGSDRKPAPAPARPPAPPAPTAPLPGPVLKEAAPLPPAAPTPTAAPPSAPVPAPAPVAEPAPAPIEQAAPASTVSAADAQALRQARIKYLEANPPAPPVAETPAVEAAPAADAPFAPVQAAPAPAAPTPPSPAAEPALAEVPAPPAAVPATAVPEPAVPVTAPPAPTPEPAAIPETVPPAAAEAPVTPITAAPAEEAQPPTPPEQSDELRRARAKWLQDHPPAPPPATVEPEAPPALPEAPAPAATAPAPEIQPAAPTEAPAPAEAAAPVEAPTAATPSPQEEELRQARARYLKDRPPPAAAPEPVAEKPAAGTPAPVEASPASTAPAEAAAEDQTADPVEAAPETPEAAPTSTPSPQEEELRRARAQYLQDRQPVSEPVAPTAPESASVPTPVDPAAAPLATPEPASPTPAAPAAPLPEPASPEAAPSAEQTRMQELLRAIPREAAEPVATPEPVQPPPVQAPALQAEPVATAPQPAEATPAEATPVQSEPAAPPAPAAAPRLNVPRIQPESLRQVPPRPSTPPDAGPPPAGSPASDPAPEALETAPLAPEDQANAIVDDVVMPDGDAVSGPDGLPADQLGL